MATDPKPITLFAVVRRAVEISDPDDTNPRLGVPQVCFMGVINPLTPDVETPEEVKQELLTAARYIPVGRLGATDDCGFSPFSRDVKPKHGSPDSARDVAMKKIAPRLEGARLASADLEGKLTHA